MRKDNNNNNSIIAVDAGLGCTGLAFFGEGNLLKTKYFRPKNFLDARNKFFALVGEEIGFNIPEIIIEGVQSYSSAISISAIKKGGLFQLAYVVGIYYALSVNWTDHIQIVNAPKWKGQLTKEATQARIIRKLGYTPKCNEHEFDAIGLGLWAQGRF